MNIYILIPLLSSIFSIFLGLLVLRKNPNRMLNRVFFLFSAAITIWLGGSAVLLGNCHNTNLAILLDRIVYVGVIFIPPTCLHFSSLFTKRRGQYFLITLGYVISIFFFIINWTDIFTYGLRIYEWGCHTRANFFHDIFLLFFAFFIFFVFKNLIDFLKETRGVENSQAKYIFTAFVILGVGVVGFLPAYGVDFYPITYICGVIAVIVITYAIIRHRLLDIRFVLRKYLVYLATVLSIILPALLIKYFIEFLFFKLGIWLDLLILLSTIAIFPKAKNYYYRIANKYFFSSLYDDREVISSLSEKLKSTLEINKIYDFISETIINAFHAKTVSILIFNEETKKYKVEHDVGHKVEEITEFIEDKGFYTEVIRNNPAIVVEELRSKQYVRFKQTFDLLDKYGIDILVPLNVKDKIIGLLALGPKESKDIYNEEDLRVLAIIGAQSAIALENAMLYEESRQFGIKLKKEVEKATAELRSANQRLKQLDEAKSEFVSIASHQLRTPLTIIKGYISMLVDGNFGPVPKKQIDPLNKVFESNERLIKMVENLLNVSRIESGRLSMNYQIASLEPIVLEVVEQLSLNANKKGLKLIYESPTEKLPVVKIDCDKIREVIMNLIDNAIKYTKQGEIKVRLFRRSENLIFSVQDNGIGMKKEDTANLFKKFSRFNNSVVVNVEGTGLGLYVAKKIISLHGGKIWAKSEGENKGSTFSFSLPVAV